MKNLLQKAVEHKKDLFAVIVSLLIAFVAYLLPSYFSLTSSFGLVSLFILGFLSTATVFLPSVAWVSFYFVALHFSVWEAALIGGAGAAVGELTSFFAGYGIGGITKGMKEYYDKVKKYGWVFIFFASIIPNPFFDIIGITAGYLRMNPLVFFLSCFFGKSIKFALLIIGGESLAKLF